MAKGSDATMPTSMARDMVSAEEIPLACSSDTLGSNIVASAMESDGISRAVGVTNP